MPQPETLQTENLNFISYFVPSMLGLSVMQVGICAAIRSVAPTREDDPQAAGRDAIRRWQLVGSNVLMRLLIAMVQAVIIVGVGVAAFGVQISGSLVLAGRFIALGAMAFLARAT